MFEDYNEEKIMDEYSDIEDIAYGIVSLVQEVRFLRKRNKELQKEVDMHNKRIRENIQEHNAFIGELLTSLVNPKNKEN